MKYIIILGDGMADLPIKELAGRTPLQAAYKPTIDSLAPASLLGMVKTVPDTMSPCSDVANLSILGYNTEKCYTGRAPLEAIGMGIDLHEGQTAIRCNLVTLSDEPEFINKRIIDYSAGEISTKEASILIKDIAAKLDTIEYSFHPGTSYRNCFVLKRGKLTSKLIPPNDICYKKILQFLPKDSLLLNLMKQSSAILQDHPVNIERKAAGLKPANSIWFWGEGTKTVLESFSNKFNLNGTVISAVDLIKGIGLCAGLEAADISGADGTVDTDYDAKCSAALDALLEKNKDFVYIHCEAPDTCGHNGDYKCKMLAIERIDRYIVTPLVEALKACGEDFSLLVLPDHPTPVSIRKHTNDPVPFLLYRSDTDFNSHENIYCEDSCTNTGVYIEKGYMLIRRMIL